MTLLYKKSINKDITCFYSFIFLILLKFFVFHGLVWNKSWTYLHINNKINIEYIYKKRTQIQWRLKGFKLISFGFLLYTNTYNFITWLPSRFGWVVAKSDLDGEVSGLSMNHTKVFKNGTYCSSACPGHNELYYWECLSHKKAQLIPYTMDRAPETKVV